MRPIKKKKLTIVHCNEQRSRLTGVTALIAKRHDSIITHHSVGRF